MLFGLTPYSSINDLVVSSFKRAKINEKVRITLKIIRKTLLLRLNKPNKQKMVIAMA